MYVCVYIYMYSCMYVYVSECNMNVFMSCILCMCIYVFA